VAKPAALSLDFDEQPSPVAWTAGSGLYFSGLQKTQSHLFEPGRFDPAAILAGSAPPPAYRRLSPAGSPS
jgi:hypothetical protein